MAGAVVFMYAGQGCQFSRMAHELYRCEPVFARTMDELDAMVAARTGRGFLARLYDGDPRAPYDELADTHPAIFAVQYALTCTLAERGLRPDYVLGMSMGEIAAATAAGALGLADAVHCVLAQAEALGALGATGATGAGGGMLAVLARPAAYDEAPPAAPGQPPVPLVLRSRNHFVLAGDDAAIAAATGWAAGHGFPTQRLPVRMGFHSAVIDAAREPFLAAIAGHAPGPLGVPFVSCARADVLTGTLPPDQLWQAVRRPIRFVAAARALAARGEHVFVELGPGTSLSTLLRHNAVPAAGLHRLVTPDHAGPLELDRLSRQAAPVGP